MARNVELVLRRSVDNLGRIGDVVKVKPGYARNYLIPHGYGMLVTRDNLIRLEGEKQSLLEEEARFKASLEAIAALGKQITINITVSATPDGTLYGSVSNRMISEYFQAQGAAIEPRHVLLAEPIKTLGAHPVAVNLGQGVEFETKIWVIDEHAGAEGKAGEAAGGTETAEAEGSEAGTEPAKARGKEEE